MNRLFLLPRTAGLSPAALKCRPAPSRTWAPSPALLRPQQTARPRSTNASPPTPKSRLPKLLLAGTLFTLTLYLVLPSPPKTLNTATFAPYTVTSTTPASPTSFILTLAPQAPSRLPYLTPSGSWWDFQWSVQVKQPELQIQREYTPLPPVPGSEDEGAKDDGTLRFYVRRVAGGEVSNFLSKKAEGDTVEVRLGERGFAFNHLDANEASDILCLAGGTGVATAMQVAHAVLSDKSRVHPDTRVRILWAVRRRSDVQSLPASKSAKGTSLEGGLEGATPIARELLAMKARYGENLQVQLAVDEEGTAINEKGLKDALAVTSKARRGNAPYYPASLPPVVAAACQDGAPAAPGKIPAEAVPANLRRPIFVCGPDGFVDKFAGRLELDGAGRFWRRGGLLGDMNAKYGDGDPWLVLGFP